MQHICSKHATWDPDKQGSEADLPSSSLSSDLYQGAALIGWRFHTPRPAPPLEVSVLKRRERDYRLRAHLAFSGPSQRGPEVGLVTGVPRS